MYDEIWKIIPADDIKTVIDIGANGDEYRFSDDALERFPNAMIYCFEPVPKAYNALVEIHKKNNRVKTFNFAVTSGTSEIVDFNVCENTSISSILTPLEFKYDKIKVRCIPLNGLSGFVNFQSKTLLKVDVQGYEKYVFIGGVDDFSYIDFIITELCIEKYYKDQTTLEDLVNLLGKRFEYRGNLYQEPGFVDMLWSRK